jgi:molecular chaperone Hsp33
MLSAGMTLEEICKRALPEFELDLLDESAPEYKCNCSRERVEAALITTGKAELEDMANDEVTSVTCHFCDKVYNFTSKDMLNLSKRATE